MGTTWGQFGLVGVIAGLSLGGASLLTGCGPDCTKCDVGTPAGGSPAGGADTSGGSAVVGGTGGSAAGQAMGGGGSGSVEPACNELPLDAPAVDFTYDAGVAPEPEGGEIGNGTYVLTAAIMYQAPPLPVVSYGRGQLQVSGEVWQEAFGDAEEDSVNPVRYTTAKVSRSGATLTHTRTCPSAGDPDNASYTATSTTLTLYVKDGGLTFGTVFTKQ